MDAIENALARKLGDGGVALGIGIRLARTVDIAKAMATAGYDWLFIDLEHSTTPLDVVAQIAVAALDARIAPFVRMPPGELGMAARLLDSGVMGIVLPHIDNAEQALDAVRHLKYPPLGHRSIGGSAAVLGFRPGRLSQSLDAINAATTIVVMLESPEAVANAREIAAVPGIDALLLGANDFCAEAGIAGQHEHELVAEGYRSLVAACRDFGKWPGLAGISDERIIARYVGLGVRFVLAGMDFPVLLNAATERCDRLRAATARPDDERPASAST